MSGKNEFDSENLIRFAWDRIHDSDDFLRSQYKDLLGQFAFDEFRNHVINEAKQNPEYILDMLDRFNEINGTDVIPQAFDAKSLKERDINFENLPISEVNEYSNRIAKALGYADNGEDMGAFKSAQRDFAGNDRKKLSEAVMKKLKGDPDGYFAFMKALDLNPELADNEGRVVDLVLDYFGRSADAAEQADMHPVFDYGFQLLAPYTHAKRMEGKPESFADGIFDLAMLSSGPYKVAGAAAKGLSKGLWKLGSYVPSGADALGLVSKMGKARDIADWSRLGTAFTAVNEAIDAAHEGLDNWQKRTIYETGENSREDTKGIVDAFKDVDILGRLARIPQGLLIGSLPLMLASKGHDIVDKAFRKWKGPDEKAIRNAKDMKRRADKEIRELDKEMSLNKHEEQYRTKSGDPDEEIKYYSELDERQADLQRLKEKQMAKAEKAAKILADPPSSKAAIRDWAQQIANNGLDALALKMYNPNVDFPTASAGRRILRQFIQ